MLVTINTDASFCGETKIGAYAFYLRSNTFLLKKSGVFREKCATSTDAEFKCIINATKVCLQQDKSITRLIINTDCKTSIAALTGLMTNKKSIKRYAPLVAMFEKLVKKYNVEVSLRWVKGHAGNIDARSYVNEWCDKEAKKQLRSKIKYSKK